MCIRDRVTSGILRNPGDRDRHVTVSDGDRVAEILVPAGGQVDLARHGFGSVEADEAESRAR